MHYWGISVREEQHNNNTTAAPKPSTAVELRSDGPRDKGVHPHLELECPETLYSSGEILFSSVFALL